MSGVANYERLANQERRSDANGDVTPAFYTTAPWHVAVIAGIQNKEGTPS